MFDWFNSLLIFSRLSTLERNQKQMQENVAKIQTRIAALETAYAGIKQDIIDIKNALPPSGGLTESEVAFVVSQLDATVAKFAALDAENPATPPAPAPPAPPAA